MRSSKDNLRAFQALRAYLNATLKSTPVLIDSKVLIVEHPGQEIEQYPWDQAAKLRFQLNEADADDLEHGAVLWRGPTAFLVEP